MQVECPKCHLKEFIFYNVALSPSRDPSGMFLICYEITCIVHCGSCGTEQKVVIPCGYL